MPPSIVSVVILCWEKMFLIITETDTIKNITYIRLPMVERISFMSAACVRKTITSDMKAKKAVIMQKINTLLERESVARDQTMATRNNKGRNGKKELIGFMN